MLKRGGICTSCSVNTYTYTYGLHVSDKYIDDEKITHTNFIKIVFRIPSNLHSTSVSVWLGFAIGSRTDLRSVWITRRAKHAQYVDAQEYLFFSPHELRNRSTVN